MKALIAILVLFTVGLAVALMVRHNRAVQEKKSADVHIQSLSNEVTETRAKLDDQEKVNLRLNTDLNLTAQQLQARSNEAVRLAADLARTQAEAKAAAEAAAAEMAKRQAKIDELTSQINDQTKQLTDLNSAIEGLNKQIAETERKLAASEGDKEFLLKELKRLQAEKAELERQFNDLAILRAQVARLREELSIAKRIEWLKMGLYGRMEQKGAERLFQPISPAGATPRPGFDLQVELKQDGTAAVVPPATNAAANPGTPPVPR
jgi:chromosome segregation ATPase